MLYNPVTPLQTPTATEPSGFSLRAAAALPHHVARCMAARSHWFALRCLAEGVHRFVAPRFVTTVAAVALLFCAAAIVT